MEMLHKMGTNINTPFTNETKQERKKLMFGF